MKKVERKENMIEKLSLPEYRRKRLRQLLDIRRPVKIMEAHNGLTGLIVEKTVVANGDQFDGIWISSLCDSIVRGKPDIELVDISDRLRTIDEIMDVTSKPVILDGGTGGLKEHFSYNVRTLERKGVSAIIIEDKIGLKKNSLFGTEVEQRQDTIENFSEKIRVGKASQLTDDFMIIARIESLILEKGLQDALTRSFAYLDAGADGIMIHSRKSEPDEIYEFCDLFREQNESTPLIVAPTSYNKVTESELYEHAINIAIYANQLMRAAYPSMISTAESILKNHRSAEAEKSLIPFNDIIRLMD